MTRGTWALVAALAMVGGCMPDKQGADDAFRQALDELATDEGLPREYGSANFFDDLKKGAGDLLNGAKDLVLCKAIQPLLKGNGQQLFYIHGQVAEAGALYARGRYGREWIYDLNTYQAVATRYAGVGATTSFAGFGGGIYTGFASGAHESVSDMVGPRIRGGVDFKIPVIGMIPVLGSLLRVNASAFRSLGKPVGGASVGVNAGLNLGPQLLLPIPTAQIAANFWAADGAGTEAVATRDADLGAEMKEVPCTDGEAFHYVSYKAENHTEAAKNLAKAMRRSFTSLDPVAWGMAQIVVALGVARDNGGAIELCGGEPGAQLADQRIADAAPGSVTPSCPAKPPVPIPGTKPPSSTTPSATDPSATDPGNTDPGNTDPGATDPGTTPGQGDTTAPVVTIVSPTDGSSSGLSVTVEVEATDETGVTRVELFDNENVMGLKTSGPYRFTVMLAPGQHTLKVVAKDAANNQGTAQVTVQVAANNAGGTTPTSGPAGDSIPTAPTTQKQTPKLTREAGGCAVGAGSDQASAVWMLLLGLGLVALRRRGRR
ncbi:MAG: hypothetical protein IT371_13695 [Deltaproteobacteria bacterium]|nr:hypothetical protein [Deltaproteobacteria bacterium]